MAISLSKHPSKSKKTTSFRMTRIDMLKRMMRTLTESTQRNITVIV